MPKSINPTNGLPFIFYGSIVHGIGNFYLHSFHSQSSGCSLTTESTERLLSHLEAEGYRLPPKLYWRGDKHHDIKTPAVLVYFSELVRREKKVFEEIEINFLEPGHGHMDVDKNHSVGSRHLKRLETLAISPFRMCRAFRDVFRAEMNKPTLIDVDFVRNWKSALGPSLEAVDLGHLANSANSGMTQYGYLI